MCILSMIDLRRHCASGDSEGISNMTGAMPTTLPIASKLYGSFSIGLTNLGNMDNAFLSLGGMEPDFGLFGGPMKKKPGMQISVISVGGNCMLCIVGECTEEDVRMLQVMLKRMEKEVENHTLFG